MNTTVNLTFHRNEYNSQYKMFLKMDIILNTNFFIETTRNENLIYFKGALFSSSFWPRYH